LSGVTTVTSQRDGAAVPHGYVLHFLTIDPVTLTFDLLI